MANHCSKPKKDSDLMPIIQPQSKCIMEMGTFRDTHPRTKFRDHLAAINEFMPAIGWIMQPKPVPYVTETKDSILFWSNKVLKQYKNDADEEARDLHVNWTKAIISMTVELAAYCKQHQTTGLVWNANGPVASLSELKKKPGKAPKPGNSAGAPAPPPPGPPGPPGPPPPPVDLPTGNTGGNKSESAAGALFSQINELGSGGITAHLKAVERDPVTGKRIKTKAGVSKDNLEVKPLKEKSDTAKKAAPAVVKPPRFELVGGKKWFIEHQKDNDDLIIEDADMRQTIYIYKCEKSTIQVRGKCNSITIGSGAFNY